MFAVDDRSGVIERVDHVKNITNKQYKSLEKMTNVRFLKMIDHYFCFFDEVQVFLSFIPWYEVFVDGLLTGKIESSASVSLFTKVVRCLDLCEISNVSRKLQLKTVPE